MVNIRIGTEKEKQQLSCHSLRHTFTTRMCEAGVNVKVIQDTLGHKDISTTVNIKYPHKFKVPVKAAWCM